jgi:membrane protein DedA with SNARE-associated domain
MLNTLIGLGHWQICLLVIYFLWQGAVFPSFPEEVIIPTLGILWGQGRIGFFESVIAVQIGLMGGDSILLSFGRFFGPKLLTRKPFTFIAGPDTVKEATQKIHKHGPWLIFVTRFTPMVRAPMWFAAGVAKMPYWTFIRSDYLASCIHISILMFAGKILGEKSQSLNQAFRTMGFVMGALLLTAIVFAVVRERRKQAAFARSLALSVGQSEAPVLPPSLAPATSGSAQIEP